MKSFQHLVMAGLLTSAALCHTAQAQQVYRCGNSYSHIPCADAVAVPAEDHRSDAQRAAAKEALKRDKALGKEMEASRRKDEAALLAREKVARAEQTATAKAAAAKAKAASKQAKSAHSQKHAGSKKSGSAANKGEPFTVTLGSGKEKKKK